MLSLDFKDKNFLFIDIDGCLAKPTEKQLAFVNSSKAEHGGQKDWENGFYCDIKLQEPMTAFKSIVEKTWRDPKWVCYFSTARSVKYDMETRDWIMNHFNLVITSRLEMKMRKENDYRPSWQVKRDNLPSQSVLESNICFAIEDDPECREMYMKHGFYFIC